MNVFALPGVAKTIRRFSKAKGVIFTLHRVLPDEPAEFSPNAILQVKPEFLEQAILACREKGFDIVDLDEAKRRLATDEETTPFAVFTFDDGYKDNLQYALPILKKHDCPFTLFIAPELIEARAEIWWQALEDIIAAQPSIEFNIGDGTEYRETTSISGKTATFDELYWYMRKEPEEKRLQLLRQLSVRYGFDLYQHCRELIMTWDELQTFIDEPLCTIGAHTMNHYELKKLPERKMHEEIAKSRDVLAQKTGRAPVHFSYPLGGPLSAGEREFDAVKAMGFETGVTTRPGGLYSTHRETCERLPRISLNGHYQKQRFLDVFLTGAIFTAHNKLTGG
jgi:peptidoglycan/xylan/chitin deacetylase (PgdA/CDA1 family)